MLSGIITAAGFLSLLSTAAPTNDWESNYGQALKTARSSGRRLLIVIDSDGKSGRTVGHVKTRVRANQQHKWVFCHVDATTEYGQEVAKKFKATQLPFVAISDPTCSVISYQKSGPIEPQKWSTILARYTVSRATSKTSNEAITARTTTRSRYYNSRSFRPVRAFCPT